MTEEVDIENVRKEFRKFMIGRFKRSLVLYLILLSLPVVSILKEREYRKEYEKAKQAELSRYLKDIMKADANSDSLTTLDEQFNYFTQQNRANSGTLMLPNGQRVELYYAPSAMFNPYGAFNYDSSGPNFVVFRDDTMHQEKASNNRTRFVYRR